jgi:hypothetical protein
MIKDDSKDKALSSSALEIIGVYHHAQSLLCKFLHDTTISVPCLQQFIKKLAAEHLPTNMTG